MCLDLSCAPLLGEDTWTLDPYSSPSRLVVCIDDLGEAIKFVILGDGLFSLTTTKGVFEATSDIESSYKAAGFVGIASLGVYGKGAYYFDPRIAAALRKCGGVAKPDVCLPLPDEDEAWAILGGPGHPGCSAMGILKEVTWTDKSGIPIFNPDTDLEVYDLNKMENLPTCLAYLPKRLSNLAKLDYRLRKYAMLYKPDLEHDKPNYGDLSLFTISHDYMVAAHDAAHRRFLKLYSIDPYEYWRVINSLFVAKRMAHYEEFSKYSKNYVKVFACSDIHETNIEDLNPVDADVVLLAGDIQGHACCSGPKPSARRIASQINWVNERFIPWCRKYPQTQFVVVAGNNDEFALDPANPLLKQPEGSNIHYLQDSGIEIKGLKIWGTPWVKPKLHRVGALKPFERKDEDFREALAKMPPGIDILVSHATPAVEGSAIADLPEKHYGSEVLAEAIKDRKPKVCVCGHIHASHHYPAMLGETVVMNVSLIRNDRFHAEYRPREFKMLRNSSGEFVFLRSYEAMHDDMRIKN